MKETDCEDERCAADAPIPACVGATLLPCDPETADDECVNGELVSCDPATGYPSARDCGSGKLCYDEATLGTRPGPACLKLEDIDCDLDEWVTLCVNGRKITCDDTDQLSESGGC